MNFLLLEKCLCSREWRTHAKSSAAEIWRRLQAPHFSLEGSFCSAEHAEGVWIHRPSLGATHQWRRPWPCFPQWVERKESDVVLIQLASSWRTVLVLDVWCWLTLISGLWECWPGVPRPSPGSQPSASVGKPNSQVDWASGWHVSGGISVLGVKECFTVPALCAVMVPVPLFSECLLCVCDCPSNLMWIGPLNSHNNHIR